MIGVAKLKQQLKQQDIRGLYLFCGEESYLIDTYVKRLCHLLVDPSLRDFNYSFYNEDNESYEAFSNDLEAYPTMAERKLIVLKNTRLMKLAEYQKPLAAQLSGLPPYVVLVIVEEDVSKIKKALLQTIEANGQLVEFKKQSPADLRAWVGRTFAEAGKNIRSEDAAYLVELCGRSLGTLRTECDKLIAAAEGQAVQPAAD